MDSCHEKFKDIIEKFPHPKEKRGNNSKLKLPRVKTESRTKKISFQGVLIFDEIAEDVKNEMYFLIFKQKCGKVFMEID